MPLDRGINFCIDLELGSCPILIPLYLMATVELIKLKDQIQKLYNKGFIRLSAFPLGSPVLFVK